MYAKLPVGMVTFGNLKYTKLAYESLVESTGIDLDIVVVVGKPDDFATVAWAIDNNISLISHKENKGFPASVNDIYDYFWKGNSQLPIVILGNDVITYPGTIDKLYAYHKMHDADWVSANELSTPEKCVDDYPEMAKYFVDDFEVLPGTSYTSFTDLYSHVRGDSGVADLLGYDIIGDSHNLCLFSRKLFDTLGYIDINFFPAYFEDNDYGRRAILSKSLKMYKLNYAQYFHFWSRTIYEENMKITNDKYFPMNEKYYISKWGGEPGKETKDGNISIFTREHEDDTLRYWRNR